MEAKIALAALVVANFGLICSYLAWDDEPASGLFLFEIGAGPLLAIGSIIFPALLLLGWPDLVLSSLMLVSALTGILNLITLFAVIAKDEDRAGHQDSQ
jgi:hypothetical protein